MRTTRGISVPDFLRWALPGRPIRIAFDATLSVTQEVLSIIDSERTKRLQRRRELEAEYLDNEAEQARIAEWMASGYRAYEDPDNRCNQALKPTWSPTYSTRR